MTLLNNKTEQLKSKVKGKIVLPDDPSYDEVREIWNTMIGFMRRLHPLSYLLVLILSGCATAPPPPVATSPSPSPSPSQIRAARIDSLYAQAQRDDKVPAYEAFIDSAESFQEAHTRDKFRFQSELRDAKNRIYDLHVAAAESHFGVVDAVASTEPLDIVTSVDVANTSLQTNSDMMVPKEGWVFLMVSVGFPTFNYPPSLKFGVPVGTENIAFIDSKGYEIRPYTKNLLSGFKWSSFSGYSKVGPSGTEEVLFIVPREELKAPRIRYRDTTIPFTVTKRR